MKPIGNEIFLNLRFAAQDVVARVPPERVPVAGRPLALHFALDKLHFFGAEGNAPRIDY